MKHTTAAALLSAALLFVFGTAARAQTTDEPSVTHGVKETGRAVEHDARRATEKTDHVVKEGVHATERGVGHTMEKTGGAIDRTGEKIHEKGE